MICIKEIGKIDDIENMKNDQEVYFDYNGSHVKVIYIGGFYSVTIETKKTKGKLTYFEIIKFVSSDFSSSINEIKEFID